MTKYRVGVIGAGRKGRQHARAYDLHPLAEVVAVADTDAENREVFCSHFGVPGYDDFRDMLAAEAIDIAAPILPVRSNPEVVIGCADSSVKGIFCEKPVAATLSDADRMVSACRERGIRFAAGDLDVNLPVFRRAREIIESGDLGEVRSIDFRGGCGHELSGGGCQIFSLMRMFAMDAEVTWINGWVAEDPWSDHDQGGAGYVRFANGIEAFMHRETDARGRGFEVACTGGVFRTDGFYAQILKAGDGKDMPAWENLQELVGALPEGRIYGRQGDDYDEHGWKWPGDRNMASVSAMIGALESDCDPQGSGDNARRVLEMAIAVRQSHRAGHTPIRLPIENRSLRLIPRPSRMENKKPLIGHDEYMDLMHGQRQ